MVYCFHDYTLDPASRELRQGTHHVALEPKVLQVLLYLLEHRDRVVSKAELLDHCWPDTFVSESALNRCLARLRKAVQPTPTAPAIIKTLHRQGYRFVAEVAVLAPSPPPILADGEQLHELPMRPEATSAAALPGPEPPVPSTSQHGGASPPAASAIPSSAGAERRQLTVLCCDVVDSTPLTGQLDPEDLHEVLRTYHASCVEVIEPFQGYVARYLGDGLLVYFGYPKAQEDAARRAVHVGLGIVKAVERLNSHFASHQEVRLAVRIGLHTGVVVMGDIGSGQRMEQLAIGATPKVAATIQALAAPNTVVISEATYYLVQGYFICQRMRAQHIPGMTEPGLLYQVLETSGSQSRLDITTASGWMPLVGRERELSVLQGCWQQVQGGSGRVVILSGEAGIGKSRLVRALTAKLADAPHQILECRCSPYHQQSPWYPMIEWLTRTLNLGRLTTLHDQITALEDWLKPIQLGLEETIPLFAALLSLSLPESRYPVTDLTPQQQRQATLEKLLECITSLAEQQPLLFIVEDLHWCDPTTLEWLTHLIDQGPTVPLLLCMTCRPEFQPDWGWRAHVTPLIVDRLPDDQVASMIKALTQGKMLPQTVHQYLISYTNGVPLYVEEMTKMLLESEILEEDSGQYELTAPLSALTIPSTLQDLLMARLDRLGAAKRTVQLGAVIGRQFSYALLEALSPLDRVTLQQDLEQIVKAEFIYQRGLPPRATYVFKHALLQEAAYQSMLKRTRQRHHHQIVRLLTSRFRNLAEGSPEFIANHCTEAGLLKESILYWLEAGQLAIQRSALAEVVAHLNRGLDITKELPETEDRIKLELRLLTTLGPTLIVTKGHSSPEVEQLYSHAYTLCEQAGDPRQLMLVLNGLRRLYTSRMSLKRAEKYAEQLLLVAEQENELSQRLEAHLALGQLRLLRGELVQAHAQFENGFSLYDANRHRDMPSLYPRDGAVTLYSNFAYLQMLLGYPEHAWRYICEAYNLAVDLKHPFSQIIALVNMVEILLMRGEIQTAEAKIETALALSTQQDFVDFFDRASLLHGIALVIQGQNVEGRQRIRMGLAAICAKRWQMRLLRYLAMIARAYEISGNIPEGQQILAQAFAHVEENGVHSEEAELYRLKGEFLIRQSDPDEPQAIHCFRRSLDIARSQQAKFFELRASLSLSRLYCQQGEHVKAYRLLSQTRSWFHEGFDTADLREAGALLTALSQRCQSNIRM